MDSHHPAAAVRSARDLARFACGLAAALAAFASQAESFMEHEVSTRLAVNLLVADAKAQKWLPAPWEASAVATGPGKGANVSLTYSDRLAKLDASGSAVADAAERTLSLQVQARNPKTGESGVYVFRLYTSNPKSIPGHYRNSVLSTIAHDTTTKGSGVHATTVDQSWSVRDPNGGSIDLQLRYEAGALTPSKAESKTYGGPDPAFFRIFKAEQGADVIKAADGTDRLKDFKLQATVADLQDLFEGSKVVSVVAAPWYSRRVFLP